MAGVPIARRTWLLRIKQEGRHVTALQLFPPLGSLHEHLRRGEKQAGGGSG